MSNYNTSTVEDFWSNVDCADSDKNFYAFNVIRSRSSKLIFGEANAQDPDWAEAWTVEKYLKDRVPFAKCLSICCGFGHLERTLSRLGVATKIIGTDIAPGAIKAAQEQAKKEGYTNIEYFTADLNEIDLPEDEYDLIWANGALHHIQDLHIVVPKLYKSLKKDGFLVANEYVGPNYQQLGLRQQEIINAVRHLLPEELADKKTHLVNKSLPSRVLGFLGRGLNSIQHVDESTFGKIWDMPTLADFMKQDPSESVNAENIIPTLKAFFDNIDVKYYDGSILYYALDAKFYDNFDINNPKHKTIVEMIFNIEDQMIAAGEIGRDNAHIICKK